MFPISALLPFHHFSSLLPLSIAPFKLRRINILSYICGRLKAEGEREKEAVEAGGQAGSGFWKEKWQERRGRQ